MQTMQSTERIQHIAIQVVAVGWLIGYLSLILFYPSLGRIVDQALAHFASAALVWAGIIGFPLVSVGLFVYLERYIVHPNAHMVWTALINFVIFFGLMTIVLTLISKGGWITFLNLNTPPLDQLPLSFP